MPPHFSNEADILLAIDSLKKGHFDSVRAAAKAFNVNHRTLARRRDGKTKSAEERDMSFQKLSQVEREVLIKRILDMDARGFGYSVADVSEMANLLIDEDDRVDRDHVGKCWAERFIGRTPELKTRRSRGYDYARAECEDPRVIGEWFRVLFNTKLKYGIHDDDVYNFDETGFMMGKIQSGMVVTAAEKRDRPKKRQSGNREWVTAIQAIGANERVVPPYIIFACKTIHFGWYRDRQLPVDWMLDHTDNG